MHVSLRRRFLAVILSVFSVAWIAAAAGAYLDSFHETAELLDAELRHTASVVMGMSLHELEEELLSRGASTLDITEHESVAIGAEVKVAFQVWLANGQLAVRTDNAPLTPLSSTAGGFVDSAVGNEQWRVYTLADARTGITVRVGEHESVRRKMSRDAAFRTVLPLIVIVPVIGLLTWIGIGRALKPLERLAGQVARRQHDDFSQIDLKDSLRETEPLIRALNRLFARLKFTFENTRRFTADAAHELRTPLGAMAVQTDVAMLATDELMRATALDYVKRSIRDMTQLVHQLLTLARWDGSVTDLHRAPLNLAAVVHAVVGELEDQAHARSIRLAMTINAEPSLYADEIAIQLVLRNLLDNAIRYTPAGGSVFVEVDALAGCAMLRVTDTGPGIAPEQREQLFQRFYRAGRNDGEGSGLGLSIVHRCVELHQGSIEIDGPDGGGLTVTVYLPLPKIAVDGRPAAQP